ncbi:hypothetical protein INR49_002204 [Caranx melampygus]|nr:hypothetical protein INR49_002204 [Caranx melampygus]
MWVNSRGGTDLPEGNPVKARHNPVTSVNKGAKKAVDEEELAADWVCLWKVDSESEDCQLLSQIPKVRCLRNGRREGEWRDGLKTVFGFTNHMLTKHQHVGFRPVVPDRQLSHMSQEPAQVGLDGVQNLVVE